jgi:hypothetical protein
MIVFTHVEVTRDKLLQTLRERFALACFVALVSILVEVREEEEEHDGVHSNPPYEGTRIVAIHKQQLEGVSHNANELYLHKNSHKIY